MESPHKNKVWNILTLFEVVFLVGILLLLPTAYQKEILASILVLVLLVSLLYWGSVGIKLTNKGLFLKHFFTSFMLQKNSIKDYNIKEMKIGYKLYLFIKKEDKSETIKQFYLWNFSWLNLLNLIQQLENLQENQ